MTARLRVAVVGGGLISQAVHLPNLRRLTDHFELIAIADASPTVASALAAKYPAVAYTDWRALLAREELDALLVCSPNATHAGVTLAALDRGLHVFVEKPLCISPQDGQAICDSQDRAGLVVQVGYMKRFAPAYQLLLDGLPRWSDRLRLVNVATYDPGMAREPFVAWNRMIHGNDIPKTVQDAQRVLERDQVAAAVGSADDWTVHVYTYTFLACLIHDVNLVHGVCDRIGLTEPVRPLAASAWGNGAGASFLAQLPNGGSWQSAWVLLPGLTTFSERASLHFDDAVHTLTFPAPYATQAPIVHVLHSARAGQPVEIRHEITGNGYLAELAHFYDCVVDGVSCLADARQAVRDIQLLRELFQTIPQPYQERITSETSHRHPDVPTRQTFSR
jgi:predicted dehydrogenase